jgi:predicted transcriptional regulator
MRLAAEYDAITKTKLASALGKASQNLHAVLQEMEECGLIRRDELGRTVVYSPTPLTRVCPTWMEQTEAAAG